MVFFSILRLFRASPRLSQVLEVRPDAGEHVHGETTLVIDGDASTKFLTRIVGPPELLTALDILERGHLRGVRSRRPVV